MYLGQVNLVQHHQASAAVVVDQPPKVLDGVWQRMLGDDEGGRLPVALRESQKGHVKARQSLTLPSLTIPSLFCIVVTTTTSRRHTKSEAAWDGGGRDVMVFAHRTMR